MKTKTKTIIKASVITICALLIIMAAAAGLFYFGILHLNNPQFKGYTVNGVDVSSYQGDIDWKLLSSQKIDFAYIKSTEGSSTVDRCFAYNWQEASKTDLRIGAYHFFSFETTGKNQAMNFCSTVKSIPDMLPPVIDVEYYGRFHGKSDIDVDSVKNELRSMIEELTNNYGLKPVIYVSSNTYNDIVKDDFADCEIWYRSVYETIPGDITWTFWQYSNRHVLKGYSGTERYVDMNVFSGDKESFLNKWKRQD